MWLHNKLNSRLRRFRWVPDDAHSLSDLRQILILEWFDNDGRAVGRTREGQGEYGELEGYDVAVLVARTTVRPPLRSIFVSSDSLMTPCAAAQVAIFRRLASDVPLSRRGTLEPPKSSLYLAFFAFHTSSRFR